jgi:hypothetical protein
VIVLRETHQVTGALEDDFETAMREEYLPALAKTDDARLLSYCNLAHGSGPSYRVVTYTWMRDGAAWEKLVRRIDSGDLKSLAQKLDALRHDVEGKLLIPLPWSPVTDIEIGAIPTTPQDHALTMFIEDTMWPYEGRLEEYVEASGAQLVGDYDASFPDDVGFNPDSTEPVHLVEFEAAFRPAFGSHRRREVILWQRILQPGTFWEMICADTPEGMKKPGQWMHDALSLRDQWQSCLLRAARWSPLA